MPKRPQIQNPNSPAAIQAQQPPPVAAPAPQVELPKTNSDMLAAQAALENQKRQDEQARQEAEVKRKQAEQEQARLEQEKRRQEEQQARMEEQKRQERERLVTQVQGDIAAQSILLSNFIAGCQQRLDASTNKLPGIVRSSRIVLQQLIDTNQADLVRLQTNHAHILANLLILMQDPQSNVQDLSATLQDYIPKMEGKRQVVLRNLDALEGHIAEEPKVSSLINIQVGR
jgi:flagellar biosynthesis GTPase FlhF